jgi:glycosyltransferase involved in cell wall biosynthesis
LLRGFWRDPKDTMAAASRPVRVLHVTEATGGGVRRHLQRLVPELRRQQVAVDLLLGSGRAEPGLDADLADYRAQGCRTAVFRGSGTLGALCSGIPALWRALRDWEPDVVHLHATRAGLVGRLGRRRRQPPAVLYSPHAFVFQANLPPLARWLGRYVERRLARVTDAFVCVSASERDAALATLAVEPGRVRLIENGLEAGFAEALLPRAAVRAAWGVRGSAPLIGLCGRLAAQKDPATLLRALAGCWQRFPGVRLAVCGSGPLAASLHDLAQRLGLEEVVLWNGFVADLPRRLSGFDLLVLPSRYEGLSYALLEALAAGVPVLAADIPANLPRPELRGPITLVPAGDPQAWTAALSAALSALPARRAQASAMAAWVRQEFSVHRQVTALAELYRCSAAGMAAR